VVVAAAAVVAVVPVAVVAAAAAVVVLAAEVVAAAVVVLAGVPMAGGWDTAPTLQEWDTALARVQEWRRAVPTGFRDW
jgi:hypothetical protein